MFNNMLNLFLNYFIYKVYKYCESLKPKAEQYVCFKYQLLWLNSIRKTVFLGLSMISSPFDTCLMENQYIMETEF